MPSVCVWAGKTRTVHCWGIFFFAGTNWSKTCLNMVTPVTMIALHYTDMTGLGIEIFLYLEIGSTWRRVRCTAWATNWINFTDNIATYVYRILRPIYWFIKARKSISGGIGSIAWIGDACSIRLRIVSYIADDDFMYVRLFRSIVSDFSAMTVSSSLTIVFDDGFSIIPLAVSYTPSTPRPCLETVYLITC